MVGIFEYSCLLFFALLLTVLLHQARHEIALTEFGGI